MLTELSLCYSIMYLYNCAQWYEQFLQVGQMDLVWFSSLSSESLCIFDLHRAMYRFNFFKFSSFIPSIELSMVGLLLNLVD